MAEPITFAVTGGRDFNDSRVVYRALDRIRSTRAIRLMVVGDATGADALARNWAKQGGVDFKVFRADWTRFGRAAGPRRNAQMVAHGLDGCVAFPGNSGTADMVRQCREAGVPVWEVGHV